MARKQTLKVFRTPIGFHDAYVAASSQKAALEAWGSDHNLFARGSAEQVDDPALMREPLASPGKVIRRLRGTTAEQIAALPKDKPPPEVAEAGKGPTPKRARKAAPKPQPKPDRGALSAAEAALDDAEQRQAEEADALARRIAELEAERRTMQKRHDGERDKLVAEVEQRRRAYEKAMQQWRG